MIPSLAGALAPPLTHTEYGETLLEGDVVSRNGKAPFFRILAVDGPWAWAEAVFDKSRTTIWTDHFTRGSAAKRDAGDLFDAARCSMARAQRLTAEASAMVTDYSAIERRLLVHALIENAASTAASTAVGFYESELRYFPSVDHSMMDEPCRYDAGDTLQNRQSKSPFESVFVGAPVIHAESAPC